MTKRLFVGLEISEEAKKNILEYAIRLRDRIGTLNVSWERSEKYHITVKFLGDVSTDELEPLFESTAMIAKTIKPISLKFRGTGAFPDHRNPKILWIGIDDRLFTLQKLALHFDSEFEKLGFKREKRRFHLHLTIARIQEPKNATKLTPAHLNEKIEPVQFTVSEIVIFESLLKSTGSIYIPFRRFTV
jgi:RNA 2',3'-cyclic 3'-phosphodiesterase